MSGYSICRRTKSCTIEQQPQLLQIRRLAMSTHENTDGVSAQVEYGAGGAVAHGPEGQCIRCQHVLITAPISCLGSEDITFKPPLPTRKRVRVMFLRCKPPLFVKILLVLGRKPFHSRKVA